MKILVVEDEWLIAMEHTSILEKAGFQVVGPEGTVKAALQTIEGEGIDAAVLDVDLNGQPSYPVAELLIRRNIPFLFLSGFSYRDLRQDFAGCRVLSKPVVESVLVSEVHGLQRHA